MIAPRRCRPLSVMEAGRPRVHVLMALQGLDTFEQGLVLGPRERGAHALIASKSLATSPAPTCVEQP
jgi:hypothetical protein